MDIHAITELNNWKQIKILGKGTFGCVSLWENQDTQSQLAIKALRRDQNMSQKHIDYWEHEVKVMKNLYHENVVRAFTMPLELMQLDRNMMAMAMEYCNKGSLRDSLIEPRNICGLPESQIKQLALNIASGLEYLHMKSIIHRDIKPENIMLNKEEDTIVYKIIDLGYCKNTESSMESYVGTLAYLAPEVTNNRYTATVDFWSFGVLLFECITGFRPFDVNPISHLSKTANLDDCFYEDRLSNGEICACKELPKEIQLSRGLACKFEDLLRLMLLLDPQKRGGSIDQKTNRRECFIEIERIMKCSLLDIYCMSYNKQLSIATHVGDRELSVSEVQKGIEKCCGLAVSEQLLVPLTGQSLDPDLPSSCYVQRMEPLTIFMFRKSHAVFPPCETRWRTLPQSFKSILSQKEVSKRNSQRLSFFCQDIVCHFRKLVNGYKAGLANLEIDYSVLEQASSLLTEEHLKLSAEIKFFKLSVTHDFEKYEKQKLAAISISSKTMEASWRKSECQLDIDAQMEKCKAAVNDIGVLNEKFNRHRCHNADIEQKYEALVKMMDKVIYRCKKLEKSTDITELGRETYELLESMETMCNDNVKVLYAYLKDSSLTKYRILEHHLLIQNFLNWTKEMSQKIHRCQLDRQNDLWNILSRLMPPSTPDASDCENLPKTLPFSINDELKMISQVKKLLEVQKNCRDQKYALDWSFLDGT